MIDAETELAEAEADWDERRALLKLPITSSGDYASLQWARISAWFAVLGIPLLLIFANPYYAGGFSVMFGLLSLGCLSAINPDSCRGCQEYQTKIKLF